MNTVTKSVLLGCFFLLVYSAGFAGEFSALGGEQATVAPSSFNLGFNPGYISYHFDHYAGFRNLNCVIGIQSDVSDHQSLLAGNFINSDHA